MLASLLSLTVDQAASAASFPLGRTKMPRPQVSRVGSNQASPLSNSGRKAKPSIAIPAAPIPSRHPNKRLCPNYVLKD